MRVNERYSSFYYATDNDFGAVEIDRQHTALLVIDMQNYFVRRPEYDPADPAAQIEKERWAQFYDVCEQAVIPNNQKILQACREKGLEVLFARITSQKQDGRDRSLDHKAGGFNSILLPPGDPAGDVIDQLAPLPDEIQVRKTTDSAVTGTNLRLTLHNMGIDTVIVTGVFTDQCVSCTVRSLADESFKVWLIEDATRAATQEIQDQELAILNNIYCHVINTEELLAAL